MWKAVLLCLLGVLPVAAQVAPIPTPTQLPGSPFSIKKSLSIGGSGSWDYLAVDPAAQRLFIAHGHTVQVVDLDAGTVVAEMTGFREAHAIALDDDGSYGYVSDGPAAEVKIFNRSNFEVEASISLGYSPRSIAFEPRSGLLFAVCGSNIAGPGTPAAPGHRPQAAGPRIPNSPGNTPSDEFAGITHIVAIDTQQRTAIADIAISGDGRFAQAGTDGAVYLTVAEAARLEYRNNMTRRILAPPRIARFDGPAIAAEAQRVRSDGAAPESGSPVSMDWSENDGHGSRANFISLPLPSTCARPQGLAVDSKDFRLFVACESQSLLILNATSGQTLAALVTGPGDDVVGYDPDRELVYSANGGGYGSLTIIQQDANTDSYAVIQNLPTLARARTLAADPSTGLVYLVTDLTGVDLSPRGGFAPIKTAPIQGSFQVLVVGR
jgi:DNA-binding beta-propeller fold protein YncE